MTHIYKETREKGDKLFQSVYAKAVILAKGFGIKEKWSQSCGHKVNWHNIPSETDKEYWQRSVYLPFFDKSFAEMKPSSVKKRRNIMNYACPFSIKIR